MRKLSSYRTQRNIEKRLVNILSLVPSRKVSEVIAIALIYIELASHLRGMSMPTRINLLKIAVQSLYELPGELNRIRKLTPEQHLEEALKDYEAGGFGPELDIEFERVILDTPLQPAIFTKEKIKEMVASLRKK